MIKLGLEIDEEADAAIEGEGDMPGLEDAPAVEDVESTMEEVD